MTNVGISRTWTSASSDDAKYLGFSGGYLFVINSICAGRLMQLIIATEKPFMAVRMNVTAGDYTLNYNTPLYRMASESYVDNKMANLEFKTITLSDYPSSMSLSPATTTLPPGFTTDNTFIMAVRLVQDGGYIRVSHDMYNAVLKYPNIVEIYATEQGLSIGLGNHYMSAIIARTL